MHITIDRQTRLKKGTDEYVCLCRQLSREEPIVHEMFISLCSWLFLRHFTCSAPLVNFNLFQVWIFGNVWCKMWLAVDVWMCTASILNLCAISLDRYVAVTRPITYPSIMSHSRAKLLIAGVWLLSFVICFPPLVGWKEEVRSDSKGISNNKY